MTALHAQRSVDAERGKLVGTHRPILAHARRSDDPVVCSASLLSNTKGLINLRGRSVRLNSSQVSGPVATLSVGFVGALDELAEVVTLDRAGAFHGRRNQFLRTARDLCQDVSEPSPNHRHRLLSAVRYGPTVARGEKHDVHEITASGAAHEC